MTAAEIVAEQALGRTPHQAALDWFAERGVPAIDLAKTQGDVYDFVLIDEVVFLDGGGFEFARYHDLDPENACTIVCRDRLGDPIDIFAWQATTGKMATWLGRVTMVGEDNIDAPRLGDGLCVFFEPMAWLQHGRDGVLLLDKKGVAALRDANTIVAHSVDDGEFLLSLFRMVPPKILVADAALEKAA